MSSNRMQKMPSLKTLSASARSATKPSAQPATKEAEKKESEKDKGCVNSFDQLKDLVNG